MMLESEFRPTSGSPEIPSPTHRPVNDTTNRKTERRPATDAVVATLLVNARLLRAHGENHLALNILRTASNRDSKNPAVLRALADTLEDVGRNEEAMFARRALVKFDYGFEAVLRFAHLLYKIGSDDEALNSYYEALSLLCEEQMSTFDIYKNMGNIFVRKGDFEGAEESYNKAHAQNPTSDVLMVNFGTLEVQRGDLGRSQSCFRRAVELNPGNDRGWTGLAMVHNEFGDHELAWGNLERALDVNPGNRTAVLLAAHWAMRDQVPHRARPRLECYLSSVESDEEMSLVLVNLFCASGRIDLANLETERVLAWNPSRADVKELRRRISGEETRP